MPILKNAKHEAFAQGLAKGMCAVDAYEQAGYAPHRSSASKLQTNPNITARVVELTEPAVKATELSATLVLAGLLTEATRTGDGASHGARVSAWGLLGKYYKLFTDKIEADVNVNDTGDAKQRLVDLVARQAPTEVPSDDTEEPH